MADGEVQKIKILVKTPKEKKDIEIESTANVKELKEQVASAFSARVEQLCLIFAGKILKDPDTLDKLDIKDGHSVHLVIKSANRPQEQAAERARDTTAEQRQANVQNSPFGLGGMGGIQGMSGLGMGSANFMEMQQQLQRNLMSNPDMLRQMMDNPMVQSLMSNPEVMRNLITSNPQMRELMERNPEITHMLNNPELMRQTMELARNPAMLQELMRTQDRAMSNLESIPGGFNALQRMYRDVQEPMMNAAQDGFGSNPFAALVNNQSTGSGSTNTTQTGTANTDPLPNPWAPQQSTTSSTTTTTSSTSTSATQPPSTSMFNTPGMQSLLSQMGDNPQMMNNMLQAPYMQAMLQHLSANPDMAQQMVANNPLFAGNPQLQDQMRTMMPTFLQQMQNPEVQNMMTNPQAMQAMMQIQQGMQQLQQAAPGMSGMFGMPGMTPPPSSTTSTSSSTTTTSTPSTTTSTTTDSTSTPTTTATTTTTPANNPDQFSSFMSQMVNMMAQGNITQPPEERFASQLEQLAAMGFVDRQANIRALLATMGDVNAAIDRILQGGS